MQPELKILNSPEEVRELVAYLQDKELIAYDSETTGLTDRHQVVGISVCAEESVAYYVVLAYWDIVDKCLRYNPLVPEVRGLLNSLKGKSLIMHNGVFDCMMADSNFQVRLIDSLYADTMILAHLLDENRPVGLKPLAAALYGEDARAEETEMKASVLKNGGTWLATNKEMYKADPQILGKYGAKDAWLTFKLFQDLVPKLVSAGLDKFYFEDESMPLLRGPTYDLNVIGMTVDVQELSKLKAALLAESEECKAFIMRELAPRIKDRWGTKFNLNSPSQLSELLFSIYKLEFGSLTKAGKEVCKYLNMRIPYVASQKRLFIAECLQRQGEMMSPPMIVNGKKKAGKKLGTPWKYIAADKEAIKPLTKRYEWIQRLADYQKKQKLLGTYIKGVEERVQYGIVRSSYLQHGTKTGRLSSQNPNLQNLPRDDQRIKHCYKSRPGKVFVAADFSQLEPRTFASYSQEPKLMAAFDGTSDFYSVVGIDTFEIFDAVPLKAGPENAFGTKYKKLRDVAKAEALAFTYGATPFKVSKITGRTVEETADDRVRYFSKFPGAKQIMLEAHELVKKQGWVENLFGRKRHIPEAKMIGKWYGNVDHEDLPYEARNLLNQACNFRIQSTGASIVNRSIIAFYKMIREKGIDCQLVSQIHDELVIECSERDAEAVSLLLRHCMENTVILPGVPLEAIPTIKRTLAK